MSSSVRLNWYGTSANLLSASNNVDATAQHSTALVTPSFLHTGNHHADLLQCVRCCLPASLTRGLLQTTKNCPCFIDSHKKSAFLSPYYIRGDGRSLTSINYPACCWLGKYSAAGDGSSPLSVLSFFVVGRTKQQQQDRHSQCWRQEEEAQTSSSEEGSRLVARWLSK